MKMTWFVMFASTAALTALIGLPALGQTHVQRVTVINSGSSQHSHISTVSSSSSSGQRSAHRQESQLSLRAASLTHPHRLNIVAAATQLEGTVKLNGQTIHRLQNTSTSIDIAPHLSVGDHVLEITGSFSPAQGSVQISLIGRGTTFSQQVSGQGGISSRIRLSVR